MYEQRKGANNWYSHNIPQDYGKHENLEQFLTLGCSQSSIETRATQDGSAEFYR